MAKTITLTVKVDDTQFQAFVKNFNNLQQQMQNLTTKWNNITSSINKTNKQAMDLNNIMKGIWDSARGVLPSLVKITEHFGKWAALIGGITMMLGTGAGLFGIDRLAN